jgi:uncharacterized protein (TIGR03382 family)
MLFIELTPTGVADPSGEVAALTLTYLLPGSAEPITETVTLAYPDEPSATPAETFLSAPELAERHAMYNVFLGLRLATRSNSLGCAAAALRATRASATTWNATHADPDIAADLELIDLYLANLAELGEVEVEEADLATCVADTPGGDQGIGIDATENDLVYGCQATRSPSAGFVAVLLSLATLVRRRRR